MSELHLKRLCYGCVVVSAIFGLSIIMAVFGAESFLTAPGLFFFERFHLAAFYIPFIFLLGGLLLRSGRLPRRTMLLLWLSPIPFLTSAYLFQIASGNIQMSSVRIIIDAFGRVVASVLFILLFAMEIAAMAKLATMFSSSEDVLFTREQLLAGFGKVVDFLGLRNDTEEELGMLNDNTTSDDPPPMAIPTFPDAPNLQNAPEKPPFPGSPDSNPALTNLIRRTLTEQLPSDENEELVGMTDDGFLNESTAQTYQEQLILDEERHNADISDKLDPVGSAPQGVLSEVSFSHRRRQKYEVPVEGLLAYYPESDFSVIDENTRKAGEVLEQTLKEFRIEARVTGISKGPVITMYELLPSPGVKISSIVNLQDNIALRLAASRVRIIAPIPGKHAIGIEVPNKKRAIVSFSSLVNSDDFQGADAAIPVILGKDISGNSQIIDLTRTPHLLIAGATGSGKSVCVNSLIGSILYSRTPQQVKMILVDPKIVELKLYNDIPHLLTQVITEPKRALQALQWCLYEMERRYSLLDSQGVRDIRAFNKRVSDRQLASESLAYIVVMVDEFADLMATSGKELEAIVARLAAMSRAVGIHLVLATQRPSVDVITGLIKANFPSRIAFMVAGKTDSRIIIDAVGAEKLLGRGDMLFTSAWDPFPSRMQGAFLAEDEVERMAEHVKTLGKPDYIDEEMFFDDDEEDVSHLESTSADDPMYEKGLEIVISTRKASASYLQRRLKIGYNRAARLVEEMERRGIVGPANGSKPRDLIHIPEKFLSPDRAEDRVVTV